MTDAERRGQVAVLGATREADAARSLVLEAGLVLRAEPMAASLPLRLLIDAHHPFDEEASAAATAAAERQGITYLRFTRPPWTPSDEDRWIVVTSPEEAAEAVLRGGWHRVFMTLGRGRLAAFSGLRDVWFLVRLREETPSSPPLRLPLERYETLYGGGPFERGGEAAILRQHGIDCLVTRNDGSPGAWPKLAAARTLGLPVVMLERAPAIPGTVYDIDTLAARLRQLI
ncbi:MAG: precorrin-6A/cobalt-precorrin-6A reductase [Pseudomonadota bacterium]